MIYAPRLGFAWQPSFLPKTVIRASTGFFYDRIQGNIIFSGISLPPTQRPQTIYYGQIADISNAKATTVTPYGGTGGYSGSGKVPTTINWNFAVECPAGPATTARVGLSTLARASKMRRASPSPALSHRKRFPSARK